VTSIQPSQRVSNVLRAKRLIDFVTIR